jgi:twitching motility two-component system response regulator PilG
MVSHRSFQRLHPLSLLAQLTSRQASGCLRVFNDAASWTFYLEQGKLTYATSSIDPFGRLDQNLRRLSSQVPTLVSAVRVQVRLLFERSVEAESTYAPDYQAVCWLVNQQYLNTTQATQLIESLAKEVIESFLLVREGAYELVEPEQFGEFPRLCQLDIRALVEFCQGQLRQRKSSRSVIQPGVQPPSARPITTLPQSNGYTQPSARVETPSPTTPRPTEPASVGYPAQDNAVGQAKVTYKIACIDDSPTVLNAINSFLDDKSFSVLMINNPVKALMQIVRNKPDLILLDVEMPNLDGYELCSLLRRHPSFKNTPIIMVTGNTGFIDRAKAKLVRASGYLTKPFTQSDLLKMVFKHLT